jgi:hypothetical protein
MLRLASNVSAWQLHPLVPRSDVKTIEKHRHHHAAPPNRNAPFEEDALHTKTKLLNILELQVISALSYMGVLTKTPSIFQQRGEHCRKRSHADAGT